MVAPPTRGIDVVDVRGVRTNQLYFKAKHPTVAARLFKLWPQLPENAILGSYGLHVRAQCWSCHCEPIL